VKRVLDSEVQNRSWIATLGVSIAERVELQQSGDIAAGEAEGILIAAEAPESTVLLVDERRARRIAIERGIHTLRTGALLVAAARRRLLQPDEVRQALQILQHERYLDARAAEDILALLRNR
jgi:predicted nucleic acid-binding protein